ncbi:hypothetical protein ACTXGL_01500 [Psychrobacter sp. T6-6]|uniref:hypothetical protein n=1 Tax=Psychrobacter sp. T6-6 TaxID=3457452 RepID=UPI003FD0F4F0
MSNLLINEPPLQVLPSLAAAIGLNEALLLQQLHYWLRHAKVEHDGKMWIYKNLDKWKEQDFPFWSKNTIKRSVKSLKDQNLIFVEKLAPNSFDRVNHYTINYAELMKIELKHRQTPEVTEQPKMSPSNKSDWAQEQPKMSPSHEPKMGPSLREQQETNKESGRTQKIEGDVLAVRDSNTESISNWQPPSKETMNSLLFMAGKKLDMTDSQYLSHVSDFKAYYEEQAANGKPIKRENLRQSKLKNWLASIADRQPKQAADTVARPHSNRSDAFSQTNEPRLTRQQQIEKNKQAMIEAGLQA